MKFSASYQNRRLLVSFKLLVCNLFTVVAMRVQDDALAVADRDG